MDAVQDHADVHVLALSPEYLASPFCTHEMDRAIAKDPTFGHGIVNGPSKKRKPEWANHAANKIRAVTVADDDIWAFIRQMASFQQDEARRLSGYTI